MLSIPNLLTELEWRGLLQDISDRGAFEKIEPGSKFYIGIDPTASSLQIGNLVPVIVAAHLVRAGLKPIFLFGGATGTIGDPGGKSAERNLLDIDVVKQNVTRQQHQLSTILGRIGFSEAPLFVDNKDWTQPISLLEFLRDVGKHFTVNYMIAKDSVKARLSGEGISYTEFSYMLLQANDFLHLFQNHSCKLQAGGSDQWGNLTAGIELIRRKLGQQGLAFSFPLVTDANGKKFGKSEGNALWLDAALTSPYKFHQFWLNVADSEVFKLLKIFTFYSKDELESLEIESAKAPEARLAQKKLADSICTLIHGEEACAEAKKIAVAFFGGSLRELSSEQLLDLFAEAPRSSLSREKVAETDLLTLLSSTVTKSKGEAKRLIEAGGAYLDNERITDGATKLTESAILERKMIILRSGKKSYHVVTLSDV